MMNELLELELWRIIGQGNDEYRGGYFGGGRGAQGCQSMKPPHELDDGWVVAETEPKIPSQSSHIGPDRDDSSLMPLRLMADGEGNEIGKFEAVPIRHAPQEIGVVSVDDTDALSPSCQSVGQDGVIVEVCHDDLKMEGRAEFHCELEVCRLDDLKEEPLRFNRQEGSDCVSHLNLFKCAQSM
ncbi:hypothetical protein GOBAR_AA11187 [Gossypium barbadense]|uniref:Uncharacterized protein n=1 Tax=Gossypium barbadense TaxID=3634 RepID=A0A2P5Y1J6_GOSBA|nr:hypothetical protein GOBAR_AA11187 [Gossypium barbadense]